MREIKFRAWDKQQKEMLDLIVLRDETGNVLMQRISQPKTVIRNTPENVEVMQYTGLKDKNGKEIYEGDIVRNRYGVNWEVCWIEQKYQWRFRKGSNTFTLNDKQFWSSSQNKRTKPSMEVIGNIWENPDLLK